MAAPIERVVDAHIHLWDPANVNENNSLWAEQQAEGTLVKVTPDGKGFMPYIAKSWQITDGGRLAARLDRLDCCRRRLYCARAR